MMPYLPIAASISDLVAAYGTWAVFAVILFESAGLPLPGETALITAGIYAGSTHQIGIAALIAAAFAAAVLGDNLGYGIGRLIGPRLLRRYGGYVGLGEARLKVGQYLFWRHGGKIVFFGRFVALLRALAALLAGANAMPWRHFLAMNALGGLCWALLFGGGAYLFGEKIRMVAGPIAILLFATALALAAAGLLFFRRHERDLEERAYAALPGRFGEP